MSEPAEVWRLIQKADEVLKYAGNRDRITAFRQASAALDEAEQLLAGLDDQEIAQTFKAQIQTRRDDLARLGEGNGQT